MYKDPSHNRENTCHYLWFTSRNDSTKVFLSRSNIYLIKKSLEKLILSNNENKVLINNLIDLVQFLTMNSTEKALSLSLSMKTQNVIMNISKIKIVMAVIKLKNS